eukprot:1998422-Pyramimonas_sp.AAC.1
MGLRLLASSREFSLFVDEPPGEVRRQVLVHNLTFESCCLPDDQDCWQRNHFFDRLGGRREG